MNLTPGMGSASMASEDDAENAGGAAENFKILGSSWLDDHVFSEACQAWFGSTCASRLRLAECDLAPHVRQADAFLCAATLHLDSWLRCFAVRCGAGSARAHRLGLAVYLLLIHAFIFLAFFGAASAR